MNTTKQYRFKEFRYDLPITCSCGYHMKCITKPIEQIELPKDIITTIEIDFDIIDIAENLVCIPINPIVYECVNCLKRIKVGDYD